MSGRTPEMWPEIMPANKFHDGNGGDGKHYWLTPPDLYASLDAEFHFDFDPCPYPLPDGFDGLTCDWGQSNYVNPPFGSIIHDGRLKGPTAWARKAIAEHRKGKTVVFVYPMHKWRLMLLAEMGTSVRNLGDVRWLATEDGQPGKGTGEHIACFVLESKGIGGDGMTREHWPETVAHNDGWDEGYEAGKRDGLTAGLVEAMRRLSAAGIHDGRCPEPRRSCTCGIDAAIQRPPEGMAPITIRQFEKSAWGRAQ